MTSKQALDNLYRCALRYEASNDKEWQKHCKKEVEIIQKDFEILSIIKFRLLKYWRNSDFWKFSDEDYIKIKEWLKSEEELKK